MLNNKRLARQIADRSFFEFRRQLAYKAGLRGNTQLVAGRWFASSKRCSYCGHCKLEMDRDLNAANCLMQLINTAGSTEIETCGQDGSVIMFKTDLATI